MLGSGGLVSKWQDQSKNKWDALSTSATLAPKYVNDGAYLSTVNHVPGTAYLRFTSGDGSGMTFPVASSVKRPYTIVMLSRYWKYCGGRLLVTTGGSGFLIGLIDGRNGFYNYGTGWVQFPAGYYGYWCQPGARGARRRRVCCG